MGMQESVVAVEAWDSCTFIQMRLIFKCFLAAENFQQI